MRAFLFGGLVNQLVSVVFLLYGLQGLGAGQVPGAVAVEDGELRPVARARDEERPEGGVQPQDGMPAGAERRVAVEDVVPQAEPAGAVAQSVVAAAQVVAVADCAAVRQVSAAQHCCGAVPAAPGVRCC